MKVTGRNTVGNLYGLTTLCPIKIGSQDDRSFAWLVDEALLGLEQHSSSPFATIPNTYLAHLFILRDVFYEGRQRHSIVRQLLERSRTSQEEHLKSQYLVFTCNFHGDLDAYLRGMWTSQEAVIRSLWQHCVGFDEVHDAASFVSYIKRCQVQNSLLFNGSNDDPLQEQLKGLYLKQEFGRFVFEHQGLPPAELREKFLEFLAGAELHNLDRPTWAAGADSLDSVVVG